MSSSLHIPHACLFLEGSSSNSFVGVGYERNIRSSLWWLVLAGVQVMLNGFGTSGRGQVISVSPSGQNYDLRKMRAELLLDPLTCCS